MNKFEKMMWDSLKPEPLRLPRFTGHGIKIVRRTYPLIISEKFPATHPAGGHPTYFVKQIYAGIKKHTIRSNYQLWKKRVENVNIDGKISIRVWTGKPYNSPQQEIATIYGRRGVGVQRVQWPQDGREVLIIDGKEVSMSEVARNDGLSMVDFLAWFEKADKTQDFALIQFGPFRY